MIRVLHIIDHLGSGGAQTALLNLLRLGDRSRFDYTVASMHGRGAVAEEFEAAGIRVLSLSPTKWPPAYVGKLWQLLHREQFEIIHFHLFGANWIAKPLAWLCGRRVLFNHDQCNDAFRTDSVLVTTIDAAINALSTRVLCVSQSIVDFLRERESLAADRLEYFPNCVDTEAFSSATSEQRMAARQRFGLPTEGLLVGGVGRLVPQKDFSTFLEAAAQVCAARADVHFVIFGEGPEAARLSDRVASLQLGDRITFAGYVSDRHAIYQAIDLLFLTSLFEGTPMVLLEAMAAGVPIAASRIDGSAEILDSEREALLFPPGNPGDAAASVRRLLADADLRRHLAAVARAKVVSRFNAETQMRHLESLYQQSLPVSATP